MQEVNQKFISKLVNILLIVAIVIGLLGFLSDFRNTLKFGGIDLRNRVVGARLLTKGLDPYYFKWRQGDDERLIDPLDWPTIPVSRVTVNPSILLFQSTFANLPYFPQRIIWFVMQWFCLITSVFIFVKNSLHTLQSKFILISIFTLISGSFLWRLHIDVGQFYIVYVLLLSLAYKCFNSNFKYANALGGFFTGLAACFRFPIIVIVLPMIIFRKFQMLIATIVSFFTCLAVSILLAGLPAWQSYLSAMTANSKLNAGLISVAKVDLEKIYPKIIEGMNNLQSFAGGLPHSDSSLQSLLRRIFSLQMESKYLIIMLAATLLLYSFTIYSFNQNNHKANGTTVDLVFLIGLITILIADFLIPAPRYPYNDVLFIIPLILLLKNIKLSNTLMLSCAILMYTGFLILNGMFSWVPAEVQVGQFLILSSMILISIIFVKTDIKKLT
jgi:hypothetical protein